MVRGIGLMVLNLILTDGQVVNREIMIGSNYTGNSEVRLRGDGMQREVV